MNHTVKTLFSALFGFGVFAGFYLLVAQLVFLVLPGSYYIDYYKVEAHDSIVGKPVMLDLCREAKGTYIPEAVRGFILTDTGEVVSDYNFRPNIQAGDSCVPLMISTDRQPQVAGRYRIETDFFFESNGYSKSIKFVSNEYSYNEKE